MNAQQHCTRDTASFNIAFINMVLHTIAQFLGSTQSSLQPRNRHLWLKSHQRHCGILWTHLLDSESYPVQVHTTNALGFLLLNVASCAHTWIIPCPDPGCMPAFCKHPRCMIVLCKHQRFQYNETNCLGTIVQTSIAFLLTGIKTAWSWLACPNALVPHLIAQSVNASRSSLKLSWAREASNSYVVSQTNIYIYVGI